MNYFVHDRVSSSDVYLPEVPMRFEFGLLKGPPVLVA